ncbi:putative 2og-fe oxygenase family protein [Naviculisporaceae sp. PSN 640]
MASTNNPTTTRLLDELRVTMKESERDFVFACGGSLPPTSQNSASGSNIDPVTLRWDASDPLIPASRCKITFPVGEAQALSLLISNMQQASFGLGGEDVMDETYRKALKLDTSKFSTNFCPYNAGIMGAISKILVPEIAGDQTGPVRAELYKLNIYEGPSGHFRSHVDTPRSSSQFGSLVVCLPAAHSGGELVVRHNGKTMVFDWGSSGDAQQVQWAAFYSDCEHEVLQVQSGQRVTLTYNLYAGTSPSDPLTQAPPIDKGLQLPLAQYLKNILSNKDFMPEGGNLGFYATHAYPHSSSVFQAEIRSATERKTTPPLKGIDRALWQTAKALGCRVILRPAVNFVFESSDDDDDDDVEYDSDDNEIVPARVPVQAIGRRLGFSVNNYRVENRDDLVSVLEHDYNDYGVRYQNFEWLNGPREENQEPALAYIAYGNEASVDYLYSYCTILISVGAFDLATGTRKTSDEELVATHQRVSGEPLWSRATFN